MYGKIFEQMYDGTLAGNWQALITFQQMIVLCDADGIIDMTPQAMSRRTGIPIEHIEEGIKFLEKEDPYSRTPDENGKRIVRLDDHRPWGWRIVNHSKYRKMASYEDKKKADRERIADKRRNLSQPVATCRKESRDVVNVAHTNTDTDTKVSSFENSTRIPHKEIIDYLNQQANTNYRSTTKATQRLIKARFNDGYTLEDFKLVINRKCAEWKSDPKMVKFLRPETLFGTKFESYLQTNKPMEKVGRFVA